MRRVVARLVSFVVLVVLGIASVPAEAAGACPDLREVGAIRSALRETARCKEVRLRVAAPPCPALLPTSSAGAVAEEALALAFGANGGDAVAPVDVDALGAQLACQRAIVRGVTSYVADRLVALVRGAPLATAEARARRPLDRLVERCAVRVAADDGGTVLPAVGDACASAVGAVGSLVDPATLRDCLRATAADAIAGLGLGAGGAQTTTVVLVRHAERDPGADPPLIAEGETRAAALATALAGARVTHIFTTQYVRNQQTAAPLATLTGVPVTTVEVDPFDSWPNGGHRMSAAVLAAPRGGVIVVIGHSSGFNSAVSLDLGGSVVAETYAAMSVLTLIDGEPTRIVRAQYGGPSSLDP